MICKVLEFRSKTFIKANFHYVISKFSKITLALALALVHRAFNRMYPNRSSCLNLSAIGSTGQNWECNSVWSHLRFPTQSAPTIFPHSHVNNNNDKQAYVQRYHLTSALKIHPSRAKHAHDIFHVCPDNPNQSNEPQTDLST